MRGMKQKMNEEILIKYIETTSKCNYSCPICVPRTRNCHLDINEFYLIIDNNLDLFYKKAIWMDFNGEPLVDPYFFDRIKYMHSKGINTRLSTNGALLNEKNRIKIAISGISYVVVSIGTLNSDLYKQIRGVDNLSIVLNNLIELKKCVDKMNSKVELQAVMIDTGENLDKEEFIKYFHNLGINVAFHNFTNRSKSVKMDINPKKRDFGAYTRGECKGLRSNIIILSNCEVVTCCCDLLGKNSLGNLREYDYSIKKLIENGRLDKIISDLKSHQYKGACKNCSDWIYYQENPMEEYVTVYPVKPKRMCNVK